MKTRQKSLALVVLFALGISAKGDVITLRNGDVVNGSIVGEQAGFMLLQSASLPDVLRVPAKEIKTIHRGAKTPIPAPKPTPVIEATAKPLAEAKPKEKPFQLPPGWDANMALGYVDREGAADTKETSAEAKVAWKSKKNLAEWNGYYKYFEQEDKKSTDRYGASQKLRHEGENGFSVQSQSKVEVDNINKQRKEISQTAGLGYAPVKSDKFTLRVTPGIEAEKITDSPDKAANRTRYKANVQQEASWKMNDKVSLGQTATYAVDPKQDAHWDMDVQAHVQTKLGENTNLRLNYKRDRLNGAKGKEDKKSGEVGASVVWDF